MGGISVTGLGATLAALERLGRRTNKAALRAVRAGAQDVQQRAIEYAPVDEGYLEDAIRVVEEREGVGRIKVLVGVDEALLGPGYSRYGNRYDVFMHEGVYNLGPRSLEKQRSSGRSVGPQYLRRAFDDFRDEINRKVRAAVEEEIR